MLTQLSSSPRGGSTAPVSVKATTHGLHPCEGDTTAISTRSRDPVSKSGHQVTTNTETFGADMRKLSRLLRETQGTAAYRVHDSIHYALTAGAYYAMFIFGLLSVPAVGTSAFSAMLLSTAVFLRFAGISHAAMHRSYDTNPLVPVHSRRYARGLVRRLTDWVDSIDPHGWNIEHNHLHHFALGEGDRDPDCVAHQVSHFARISGGYPTIPFVVSCLLWKLVYYPVNNIEREERELVQDKGYVFPVVCTLDVAVAGIVGKLPTGSPPRHFYARVLWRWSVSMCVYVLARYVVLAHAVSYAIGTPAAALQWHLFMAEMCSNVHSFVVIAPNHTGGDLCVFEGRVAANSDEFFERAVRGSANYTSYNYVTDTLMGYLNFQIEHHSFPWLSMYGQRRAQPMVRALCEKHGIPYTEEHVLIRFVKMYRVFTGRDVQAVKKKV